jgi:hypothetical protein
MHSNEKSPSRRAMAFSLRAGGLSPKASSNPAVGGTSMINKLWNLTWYAYIGASLLDPRFSVQYIGRYTKRAVMAEYRIVYYDGKIVRFSYKDYAEGGKTSYITLKVHTFIGRLIRHIPDKDFPMIRYAGLFANRWKKQYLFDTAGKDAYIAPPLLRPG